MQGKKTSNLNLIVTSQAFFDFFLKGVFVKKSLNIENGNIVMEYVKPGE